MSTPRTRRGRPKDLDKRKAILEAAKLLFVEMGYAGTTMDRIAAAAGVSKLTLYSHYGQKDDLFQQCVVGKCQEHVPDAIYDPASRAPLRRRLLTIGTAFVELIMSDEAVKFYRMMAAEARQTGRLGKLFYAAGPQRTLDQFELLLRAAEKKRELKLRDPRRAANHFFSLLQGEHHMRALLGERPAPVRELRAHVADVVEVFLKAYAPD